MSLPAGEVRLFRAALGDVSLLAYAALVRVWRTLDTSNATGTRDALTDVLAGIIPTHHVMAAAVAADWYDLMRLHAELPRRFDAIVPEPPDAGRAFSMAGWAVGPLFGANPAPDVALSKLSGGLQRVVTDAARDTVTVSSVADPTRPGWVRAGTGRCDYCRVRIGLHIRDSTVFSSHDACGCVAVPGF